MKLFSIGDQVSLIEESLSGIIKKIQGQRALVELDDGFTEWISFSKIVLKNQSQIEINQFDSKHVEKFVEIRAERIHEVDLHIENLVIEWQKIQKEKILERQLSSFMEEYKYAIKNKYDKLIVIHGKGKGILKNAVLDVIRQKGFQYREMNEGKYKNAALEIVL